MVRVARWSPSSQTKMSTAAAMVSLASAADLRCGRSLALSFRPDERLAQVQESRRTSRKARGGRGVG
jgi:hypothetical protein